MICRWSVIWKVENLRVPCRPTPGDRPSNKSGTRRGRRGQPESPRHSDQLLQRCAATQLTRTLPERAAGGDRKAPGILTNYFSAAQPHNQQGRGPKGPPGAIGKPPASAQIKKGAHPKPLPAREGLILFECPGGTFPRESFPRSPCKGAGAAAPGPRSKR